MDSGSYTLLSRLIAMGSGSLLQYVSESFPWSADPNKSAVARVRQLSQEERGEVTRFMRIIQKKHLRRPPMGAYPSHFSTINFCSLDYALPKLIAEHTREIAEIESRLPTATDADIAALAQGYLNLKRSHLQTLQELKSP